MDPGELQAVLAWSSLPFVGERTLLKVMDHAREGRMSLAELWSSPVEDLRHLVALHPKSCAALDQERETRWSRAGEQQREIAGRGVDLLVPSDPGYPPSLEAGRGDRRWPLLFAYGALGLLDEPRVAFANSRTAAISSIAVTDAVADALARRDVTLVTSTSREAYQAAAVAAKRHASPTVLVPDRSLSSAVEHGLDREPVATARVWDTAFDPDLQLLLSPYAWGEPWSPRSGPRRDALIFTLADVVIAVDVRSEGVIAAECRRAAAAGKTVLALDRGDDTPDGIQALVSDPGVTRIRWSGAEAAVTEVLRALPAAAVEAAGDRELSGRLRELGQFLARACAVADTRDPEGRTRGRVVEAFPAAGVFSRAAKQWASREAGDGTGPDWLLADLTTGTHPASRPAQLLERLRPNGLLAVLVPAAWLEDAAAAAARAAWLERATLRLVARLPAPVAGAAPPTAAVLIQKTTAVRGAPARVFSPDRDRMGRFHLRRYVEEVLAALAAN